MTVLQDHLPVKPWMQDRTARLPGIQPVAPGDWLRIDEAYAGQMAERERLIETRREAVHALLPGARDAANELLERVQADLPGLGFEAVGAGWRRPDGRVVAVDPAEPLLSLGRLVQEDFCILQPGPDAHHVLTGAILCFPASWTLAEKIGRGMPGIHTPVPVYDAGLAARVQRLLDAVRPGQPLWRANALDYVDPALFQPRSEADKRPPDRGARGYIRSERQCLVRLPRTQAVVFSIHTYVVRRETLTPEEEAAFAASKAHG